MRALGLLSLALLPPLACTEAGPPTNGRGDPRAGAGGDTMTGGDLTMAGDLTLPADTDHSGDSASPGDTGWTGDAAAPGDPTGAGCGDCDDTNPCTTAEACNGIACTRNYDPDACDYSLPDTRAERLGIYAWGMDDSSWSGSDRLSWGTGLVAELGARTVRVYIGPDDIYQVNPQGSFSLAAVAASPPYAALFGSARFDTYLLTTYSMVSHTGAFLDGLSEQERTDEIAALRGLGEHLLATHANKTFILLQWEGDNQIGRNTTDATRWQGFTDWIAARTEAVALANISQPTAHSRLYSGLEFNLVEGCDETTPCIINRVAPFVDVNVYSYSAWESVNESVTGQMAARLTGNLDAALAWVRTQRPTVGPARFIVGEYGFARELTWLGECVSTQRLGLAAQAALAWGVRHAIHWQIVDNPPQDWWLGFGLYEADGSRSIAADRMENLLSTAPIDTSLPSGCGHINAGGVVDGVTYDADIRPGDVLSIFGTGFSASGNAVRLRQLAGPDALTYEVTAGSPDWYESATQINVTLPAEVVAGTLLVWVVGATGLQSNGQVVTVLTP